MFHFLSNFFGSVTIPSPGSGLNHNSLMNICLELLFVLVFLVVKQPYVAPVRSLFHGLLSRLDLPTPSLSLARRLLAFVGSAYFPFSFILSLSLVSQKWSALSRFPRPSMSRPPRPCRRPSRVTTISRHLAGDLSSSTMRTARPTRGQGERLLLGLGVLMLARRRGHEVGGRPVAFKGRQASDVASTSGIASLVFLNHKTRDAIFQHRL